MQLSKKKNTIILKGMASNLVDEAIVVLKPNVKLTQKSNNGKEQNYSFDNKRKMIVLKEAENTIDLYLKQLENENKIGNERIFRLKYNFLKICNIILIFTIVVISLKYQFELFNK